MPTLQQELQGYCTMSNLASELAQSWHLRLLKECPTVPPETRQSIIDWLMGEDRSRFENLTPKEEAIARQAMDYRYRILRQRYLNVSSAQAYRHLIQRLGSLMVLRNKIRTWVALSRDRQRAVADVLQEVIQEMLNSDRYIQSQIAWIGQCSSNRHLQESLLLASIEEYSLRPIRNQPLLVYRFVNFLRRSQRGGMTQIPQGNIVRLISEEVTIDEEDSPVSLLDSQAIANYEEEQAWEEQQSQRLTIQEEFESYLAENLGPVAVRWLQLYLQGRSQDAIAKILDLPIKQVYRLREKVSYHAIRVFTLKEKPELVFTWLQTSLKEHNLGLTPQQWQEYCQSLNTTQSQILEQLKAGQSIEAIAKTLNWKVHQVMGEWTKLYLTAQGIRSAAASQR